MNIGTNNNYWIHDGYHMRHQPRQTRSTVPSTMAVVTGDAGVDLVFLGGTEEALLAETG